MRLNWPVIIVPQGGLCNRLLALDSAKRLAHQQKKRLWVIWSCDSGLNARYDRLFEVDAHINRIFTLYPNKFSKWLILKPLFQFNKIQQKVLRIAGRKFYQGLIIVYHYQFPKVESFFSTPIPTAEIRKAISEFSAANNIHSCIGVHIRRGDHDISIAQSPTNLFINEMNKHIMENSQTKFFVCSDSENEFRILEDGFPYKIIRHPTTSLDRNTEEGISEAVKELYLLSETKFLIRSGPSTFSGVAGRINNVPSIEIFKKKES